MFYKKSSDLIKQALLAALVLLMPVLLQARQVNITVSDTTAIAGEEILIPVMISEIDLADQVISGSFEFSLNETIFELTGYEKQNTLLENNFDVFFNSGTNKLAFAGTDTLSGSGVLIYLKVQAKPGASYYQYTDLNFAEAYLNEGSPEVVADGARLQIKGITIQPRSSSIQVLEGDSLQFELNGDFETPISWFVTDTSVAQIDNLGLLIGKVSGLIQVKAEDAQGLRDSTAFFRVQPITLESLEISVPDTAVRQTKSFNLPVEVSDLTGLQIISAGVKVNYDSNDLELTGVTSVNTLTESWGEPTLNMTTGEVSIASAGTDTLEGAGVLYYLNFRVKEDAYGNSTISLSHVLLNEGLEAVINNGTFSSLAAPDIFISQSDTTISVGDVLAFNITGGEGTAPYTWQVSDENVASIDGNTGDFTAVNRGEITVHALDTDNFPSEAAIITINDFDAWLDTVSVNYSDTAEVQLLTKDLSSYDLISYGAELKYDTTKMEFIGLNVNETQSENLTVQSETIADSILIAAAGSSTLSGQNSVVKLLFRFKEAAQNGDLIPVELLRLEFDEPGPNVPTITPLPGFVEVIRVSAPEAPELQSPVNNATEVDINAVFDWTNVMDANQYRFQLSIEDTFTSTEIDTLLISSEITLSNLGYETIYYWQVLAVNDGGESNWSNTFSFTTQIAPPDIPELLAPQDGAVDIDTLANLQWSETLRADSFFVELASDSLFTNIIEAKSTDRTTTSIGGLDFTTGYFWRVKASNSTGDSEWSQVYSFTTKKKDLSTPSLMSPANEAENLPTNLTFEWSTSDSAESYQFQLSQELNFNSVVIDSSEITETSLAINNLDTFTIYYWRVRAIEIQDTSGWSSIFSFTTQIEAPDIPNLLEPADSSVDIDTAITLVWDNTARADSFTVQVSKENDFTNVFYQSSGSDTTGFLDGLNYETTYFWRVNAANSTGVSDWSQVFSFNTKEAGNIIPVVVKSLGEITLPEDFGENTAAILDTVFTDPSGESLSYEIMDFSSNVFTVSLELDTLRLSSLTNMYGSGSVVIKAANSNNDEVFDTLSVEVTPVNDLPEIAFIPDTLTFRNDEQLSFSLDTSITDIENELSELNITVTTTPDDIVVTLDENTFTVTLSAEGYTGEGSITITVTDSDGGEVQATIVVVVLMSTSNELDANIPNEYALLQNYPNPFNPSTVISYHLPHSGEVRIQVFDMLGREVATLVNERKAAGRYTVRFEAGSLSSGMYIYRIEAGSFTQTRKLMLIK